MINERIKIVKIGGNVVDSPEALREFATLFSKLQGPKILVHGGGKEATRMCKSLDIEPIMIEGRRVTDAATLDVVTMIYAGLVNKRVVSLLQSVGVDAIGLCGADASIIKAKRRSPEPIDYGFVGDISQEDVDVERIQMLISGGLVPVFCAITHDGYGQLLNCNADSVASAIAKALAAKMESELFFCFEKPGVMMSVNDPDSVIPLITPDYYRELKETYVVSDGMIPKIDNAFQAIRQGIKAVYIKHYSNLLNDTGTMLRL